MRLLISLVSFLLTLAGCDPQPGITTLTISSVDGVKINSTKAHVSGGAARFECLHSASGRCYYVVFTRDCKASSPDDAEPALQCGAKVLARFELESGATRTVSDVPADVVHCVDHETVPMAPGCRKG